MTKPIAPTRLLVVHPDDEVRTFLRRRFTRLGFEVTGAAEHAETLTLIGQARFDLALVDLQTPGPGGAEGLDLLRRMRERRSPEELPILAIAEQSAGEDAAEALALGADDCLFRPLHVDLAHARAVMLVGPCAEAPASSARRGELQARLETLEEATLRTEAFSAGLDGIGVDDCSRFNGLLGATSVLTRICRTPALTPAIDRIDTAAAALDVVMVRALGFGDRRNRAPKDRLRVLLAARDADCRMAVRELLGAADVDIELVLAAGGSEAVLATDTGFFDLIVMNLAGPEEIAGIQAIRRAERQNRTRRTPMLVIGDKGHGAAEAHDAGADLFMRQPVTPERLLGALADTLARESEDVRAVA